MNGNLIVFVLIVAICSSVGCSSLRPQPTKIESRALAPAARGILADASNDVRRQFGSKRSGFHLLTDATDAMRWRLALVDHATQSIDIQYYLWNNDEAGRLLFSRLLDAADSLSSNP